MLTVPFLSKLDPRGAVKGSRDPLGVQPIWTRFGRHVVGNLTTVSTSVRDFSILLLGYHFAELLGEDAPGGELGTFLKWEQLAAYARAHFDPAVSFRGVERVREALSEGPRITISADIEHQILALQKIYGLWGLYTVSARASGLLEGDPTRLTQPARDLVEHFYLPDLNASRARTTQRIAEILRRPLTSLNTTGTDEPLLEAVASVLRRDLRAKERNCFRTHLMLGGSSDRTHGLQEQLAGLLLATNEPAFRWSPAVVRRLERQCSAPRADSHSLASRLARIRAGEAVLAPSVTLFAHLLGMDGQAIEDAAARLRHAWGPRVKSITPGETHALEAELGDGDAGKRWGAIAEHACAGEYEALIRRLLEQNRSVMEARGSAPWIEERSGRFHVRFHEERGDLPGKDELTTLWRHSYFLDSLRTVTLQIGGQS